VSRSPRGRGRGRGGGRPSVSTPAARKEHVTVEDNPLQSDDDIVTVNSVKLGKRSVSSVCINFVDQLLHYLHFAQSSNVTMLSLIKSVGT